MRRFGIAMMTLAISACSRGPAGTAGRSPDAHQPAPDFAVQLVDGEQFHRKDALGSVLVVDFWTTWCAPCRTSLPALDAVYRQRGKDGLRIVSVNEDEDPAKAKAMIVETKVSYPVALDGGGNAAKAFGVETMPSAFVIDRKGIVRYVHLGYPPNDASRLDKEVQELLAEPP